MQPYLNDNDVTLDVLLGESAAFAKFNLVTETFYAEEGAINEGFIGEYLIEVRLNDTTINAKQV